MKVVVIGAGQGGLSAAIHARLAGHDVLVFEQREVVGGKAASLERDGYRLDPGPSIVILPRLYEDVFQRAGRAMEPYLRFRRLDPISRVIFEDEEPLDLPASADACLEAIGRRAPRDVESVRALLAKLDRVAPLIDRSIFRRPYERPWQLADPNLVRTALHFDVRATYRELVDGMFESPLLRAFFYGFPSYSGQTYDSRAPGALLIPYYMVREGVWWPEGGVGAIPSTFARLARELGVRIEIGVRVRSLETDGRRVSAVRLADGSTESASAVIANVDRFTVAGWLGRRIHARPSLSYFTVTWGIRRTWPNLAHHMLIVPRSYENAFELLYRRRTWPSPPLVYVNAVTVTDPSLAPPGRTSLFAVVTVPACEAGLDWDGRRGEFSAEVRRILARNGWSFSDEEVDFEEIQTPATFKERDGNYEGSLYGLDEGHRLWGLFPATNRDPSFANLFYAGGSVQPGAGLPMVTLSGMFAARALGRA